MTTKLIAITLTFLIWQLAFGQTNETKAFPLIPSLMSSGVVSPDDEYVNLNKLVSVSFISGFSEAHLEKFLLPNGTETLKLSLSTGYCEDLPAFFYQDKDQLFLFLDESKKKVTVDVGCSDNKVTILLDNWLLEASTISRQYGGLVIPNPSNHYPFTNQMRQDLIKYGANLKTTTIREGSYNLSVERLGGKILSAELSVANSNGYFTKIVSEVSN